MNATQRAEASPNDKAVAVDCKHANGQGPPEPVEPTTRISIPPERTGTHHDPEIAELITRSVEFDREISLTIALGLTLEKKVDELAERQIQTIDQLDTLCRERFPRAIVSYRGRAVISGDDVTDSSVTPWLVTLLDAPSDTGNAEACRCGQDDESVPSIDSPELEGMLARHAGLYADWSSKYDEEQAAKAAHQATEQTIDSLIDNAGSERIRFRGVAYDRNSHDLLEQLYGNAFRESDSTDPPPASAKEPAANEAQDKDADRRLYAHPLDGAEADAIAGTTIDDAELAHAFDERGAASDAVDAAHLAVEAAERRMGDASKVVDRSLRRYPGRVISYRGFVHAVRAEILGNGPVDGAPVVHLTVPIAAVTIA